MKYFSLLLLTSFISAQTLVSRQDSTYISVQDFENQYAYTLQHDTSRTLPDVLDDYLRTQLFAEEADTLSLTKQAYYSNFLNDYYVSHRDRYLSQEPLILEMTEQINQAIKTEKHLVRYKVSGINASTAKKYQKKLTKNVGFFEGKPNAEEIDLGFIRPGTLPYLIDQKIFVQNNASVDPVLVENNNYVFTRVLDSRPFSGSYKLRLLLIKGNNEKSKQEIETIHKTLTSRNFEENVLKYSQDFKTKTDNGLFYVDGNRLLKDDYQRVSSLEPGAFTQPFLNAYGWNILQLVEHDTSINPAYVQTILQSPSYQEHIHTVRRSRVDSLLSPTFNFDNLTIIAQSDDFKKLAKDTLFIETKKDSLWQQAVLSLDKAPLWTVNDGFVYSTQLFAAMQQSSLMHLLKDNTDLSALEDFAKYAFLKWEDDVYHNYYEKFNPAFKQEIDQYKLSLKNDVYRIYLSEQTKSDSLQLQTVYQKIKHDYMWSKREEVIIAYCGNDTTYLHQATQALKKSNDLTQLNTDFSKKAIYFRKEKLTFDQLPKDYDAAKSLKTYMDNGNYLIIKTLRTLPPEDPSFSELMDITLEKAIEENLNQQFELLKTKAKIDINTNEIDKLEQKYYAK